MTSQNDDRWWCRRSAKKLRGEDDTIPASRLMNMNWSFDPSDNDENCDDDGDENLNDGINNYDFILRVICFLKSGQDLDGASGTWASGTLTADGRAGHGGQRTVHLPNGRRWFPEDLGHHGRTAGERTRRETLVHADNRARWSFATRCGAQGVRQHQNASESHLWHRRLSQGDSMCFRSMVNRCGPGITNGHSCARTHEYGHMHTNRHAPTHTRRQKETHTHTHANTHAHAHTHERTHERTIICLIMDRKGRRYARRKETSQKIRILLLLRILLLFCSWWLCKMSYMRNILSLSNDDFCNSKKKPGTDKWTNGHNFL